MSSSAGSPCGLRAGVRYLILAALEKSCPGTSSNLSDLAGSLENQCHLVSLFAEDPRGEYSIRFSALEKALPEPFGDFLETTLGKILEEGAMLPAQAVTPEVCGAYVKVTPRQKIRAEIYAAIGKDERFRGEEFRRETATLIERGCFNSTIAHCQSSTDSYRRQWDSPMFVAVYRARCGAGLSNIAPGGLVFREVGGCWALDKLASGEWKGEELGFLSASDLCPQASVEERKIVDERLHQRVDQKTSTLFKCPACHKRNATYRQVQIGAGDEASSFLCTCVECGEKFEGHT